ncbi:MAG: hypothetical protein OEL52_05215 [Nitrosopumilus sp.]|nr:hypothetical protein [Nitrosopumilus sp.]MDH3824929.1 hypothetical protein [Nitrosopumilus sp.]
MTFEEITPEFISENQKQRLCQTMPIFKKSGGPYSKQDKQARQNEVYRYHFEYGYSARKIAELMKINRNTINGDIKHWYSIISNSNDIQPESALFTILERLDIQRTRTREYLDKTSNISEKITIEKMILDIDCKIAQINQRIFESAQAMMSFAIKFLNDHLKEKNQKQRYLTFGQKMTVSDSAIKRIDKIISEDKKNLWSRQN